MWFYDAAGDVFENVLMMDVSKAFNKALHFRDAPLALSVLAERCTKALAQR